LGFEEDSVSAVTEAINQRREWNTQPVTLASYALDPRLRGENLNETEWLLACDVILKIAESDKLDRSQVLGDLAEYRSKSGTVFGNNIVWEAFMSNVLLSNSIMLTMYL
jgi:hypothetical protein